MNERFERLSEIIEYANAHEAEMLEDLKTLCRIESVRGEPEEGAPFGAKPLEALLKAKEIAASYGFAVKDYNHMIGVADLNPDAAPALDILTHVDVVPGGDGWTVTDPFDPVVKDGILYGRGTADDKGGVITSLYAMRAVKELGIPVSKRVRLLWGSCEETGSADVDCYYSVEAPAPMTISPDAEYPIYNGEKGRVAPKFDARFAESKGTRRLLSFEAGNAVNQVPGVADAVICGIPAEEVKETAKAVEKISGVTFEIEEKADGVHIRAVGKCAHASTPNLGINALQSLGQLLLFLKLDPCEGLMLLSRFLRAYPAGELDGRSSGMLDEDDIFGKTTCSLGIIKMTPTTFHAEVDYRLPLSMDNRDVPAILKQAAGIIGADVTITKVTKAHYVPEEGRFLTVLKECYEAVTGKKGECKTMGGGTYVHDVPGGVAFGYVEDEEKSMIHGPNENIPVESLKKTVVLFATVIAELCK